MYFEVVVKGNGQTVTSLSEKRSDAQIFAAAMMTLGLDATVVEHDVVLPLVGLDITVRLGQKAGH